MDSFCPSNLKSEERLLWDTHVDSLLRAYEEYKKTISSDLKGNSNIEHYMRNSRNFRYMYVEGCHKRI